MLIAVILFLVSTHYATGGVYDSTKSVIVMDSGNVILSALPPERFSPKEQEGEGS